jgi:hypothetical protein
MRTCLHRTCHRVVFGICNSQLPFRTDFLELRLKVTSNCRHHFSPRKHIPGFQSCQTTSASLLELDPYETVFWKLAKHWCLHLFSTQLRKSSSLSETHRFRKLRKLVVKIGIIEICRQFETSEIFTFRWQRLYVAMLPRILSLTVYQLFTDTQYIAGSLRLLLFFICNLN